MLQSPQLVLSAAFKHQHINLTLHPNLASEGIYTYTPTHTSPPLTTTMFIFKTSFSFISIFPFVRVFLFEKGEQKYSTWNWTCHPLNFLQKPCLCVASSNISYIFRTSASVWAISRSLSYLLAYYSWVLSGPADQLQLLSSGVYSLQIERAQSSRGRLS